MLDNIKNNYNLKTYGSDILKKIATPVTTFDAELNKLATDMIEIMSYFDGIGLAAPQIGISKRLVIVGVPENEDKTNQSVGEAILLPQMPVVMVNPEIVAFSKESFDYNEGCLSLPHVFGDVNRPYVVIVKYQDLSGKECQYECGGLLARCIQHEIDHLDGIVFVDRMGEDERSELKFKLFRLEKQGKKKEYNRLWKK